MSTTPTHSGRPARVLLLSTRRLLPRVPRGCNYEFEDTICELDDAELHAPSTPAPASRWAGRVARGALRHLPFLESALPSASCPVSGQYDLLFVCAQSPMDLYLLGSLKPWREHCRVAICWIDELWAASVPQRAGELEQMAQFDHIVLGCHGTVSAVGERVSRPVTYVPPGVDTVRFCPWPDPPARSIDVYNMGRRSPETHQALLDLAEQRGWFYLYDTVALGDVHDSRAYRRHVAGLIQRSHFFITNRPKCNRDDHTRGQHELGFRFFEGAAAGAVLVGAVPQIEPFETHFGWPDAVTHMPVGTTDLRPLLELAADPDRCERIRRRNVLESLRRHDWLYRWQRILDLAGLPHTEAMTSRARRLEQLARVIPDGQPTNASSVGEAPVEARGHHGPRSSGLPASRTGTG